jgi:hypothetical protein
VVRALDALGPLRPFYALGTLYALGSLHACDALRPVFAAISPFRAVLAAIGAGFALGPQLHPQPVLILAQPNALEIELARELLDGLRDLLALLRGQAALADAHFAHILIEQRPDLGNELLQVDRAGGIARHIEPNFFALVFPPVFLA